MNWEAIGAVGEIVGAIAVVATLIYLGVQVRHGSALAKANAYREIHQGIGELFGEIMRDPELHRIWRSGLVKGETLNEEDGEKLGMILYRFFGTLDAGYHSSWLDPELHAFISTMLGTLLEFPAVQQWWSRQGHLQAPPFQVFVEARLREIRGGSTKNSDPPYKSRMDSSVNR